MRFPLLILFLLGLAAATLPAVGAKGAFYEKTVAPDTNEDFGGNGALDILAIHVAEKFAYDLDAGTGQDVMDFRFEVRKLTDLQSLGNQAVRYDIHFKVDGADKTASISAIWTVGASGAAAKPTLTGSGYATADSIVVRLPTAELGLNAGSSVTGLWGSTNLVSGDTVVIQDVAPYDNKNAPAPPGATPTASTPYEIQGGYPYIVVRALSPLTRYSVRGSEVRYEFDFRMAEGISGDRIIVLFPSAPTGWEITPSHGTAGPPPVGQVSNVDGGSTTPFFFSAASAQSPPAGVDVPILMEAITLSGGHAIIQTLTTVTEDRVTSPAYDFELLTPGPFKTGQASIASARITTAESLVGQEVSADLLVGGKLQATVVGVAREAARYDFLYTFPAPGTWTVDVYVNSLAPSPHQAFQVLVEKEGGLAPGPELVGSALLGLGIVAGWRRVVS